MMPPDHSAHTVFRRPIRRERGRLIAPQAEIDFAREPFALVAERIRANEPEPAAQPQEFTPELFTL